METQRTPFHSSMRLYIQLQRPPSVVIMRHYSSHRAPLRGHRGVYIGWPITAVHVLPYVQSITAPQSRRRLRRRKDWSKTEEKCPGIVLWSSHQRAVGEWGCGEHGTRRAPPVHGRRGCPTRYAWYAGGAQGCWRGRRPTHCHSKQPWLGRCRSEVPIVAAVSNNIWPRHWPRRDIPLLHWTERQWVASWMTKR